MKERMHQKLQQRQEQQQQPQQRPATSVYTASSGETIVQTPRVPSQANATTNQLPAQAISQAESNLVEWAQAHMTPSSGSGSGQKKKKKNKK
jgi:hypothetical protein